MIPDSTCVNCIVCLVSRLLDVSMVLSLMRCTISEEMRHCSFLFAGKLSVVPYIDLAQLLGRFTGQLRF